MVEVRRRPTRRQVDVLRAYIAAGSIAATAYELDVAESTARQHLSGLYRRTGCLNAAQAPYWLGRTSGPLHTSCRCCQMRFPPQESADRGSAMTT